MNRILLACFALALPTFTAAAPCSILPYVNQCQGSNYWPNPANWGPGYSPTTCQPIQPTRIPAVQGWHLVSPISTSVHPSKAEALAEGALTCGTTYPIMEIPPEGGVYGRHQPPSTPCVDNVWNQGPLGGAVCARWLTGACGTFLWPTASSSFSNHPACPSPVPQSSIRTQSTPDSYTAYINHWAYSNKYWYCLLPTGFSMTKPSDGVCTARWTSAAMTDLVKDPLDPDCAANSCVLDGTCRIR